MINALYQECGLIEVIDDTVEWDEQQAEISPGALTTGLVMNFLTEGQPMYRLSELFQDKDPQNLFGDDISAEDLYETDDPHNHPYSDKQENRMTAS